MSRLVFLDIETTGLDPRRHEILEVAMLVRPPGQEDYPYNFSLNIDPTKADPKALEVNHYYERQADLAARQVSDVAAGTYLYNVLLDHVVVGNNPQFDLRFIEQFLITRSSWPNVTPWNYHPVDLKALVAGRLGLGEPPWSTKDIAREAGVPLPDDAHSALADATWNRDVYDAVMNYQPTPLPNGSVNPPPGARTGRMSCAKPNLSQVNG